MSEKCYERQRRANDLFQVEEDTKEMTLNETVILDWIHD